MPSPRPYRKTLREKHPLFIKPAALQIVVQLNDALEAGVGVDILPGSHFAQRIALIVAQARTDGDLR